MAVADLDDGEPALGEGRLGHTVGQATEEELIRPDAEADGDAVVGPTAGTPPKVEAAAVGDEPRFDFRIGGAEDNRVVAEVGVDVAQRGQDGGEEFVARAIGLAHRELAPEVDAGGHGVFQRGERGGGGTWSVERGACFGTRGWGLIVRRRGGGGGAAEGGEQDQDAEPTKAARVPRSGKVQSHRKQSYADSAGGSNC